MKKVGIYPPTIAPVGNDLTIPVSQGIRWGNLVFTTAKPGLTLDGELPKSWEDQVKQVFSNLQQILNASGTSCDNVLMTRVWMFEVPGETKEEYREKFKKFNEIYKEYFKPPYPARGVFWINAHSNPNCYIEVDLIAGVPE